MSTVGEVYKVRCPRQMDTGRIREAVVPGSKSITNRALLLAAMAEGTSTLKGCLTSDDARYFLECLKTLGFQVKEEPDGAMGVNVTITGFGGKIPNEKAEIYVGSAGTAARFLVAMLAFSGGDYRVDSSEQMKSRPMEPLITALREAGAQVECLEEEGHFPLRILGIRDSKLIPDRFRVNIDKSSQFLSALLIAAGTLRKKVTVEAAGSHGMGYVDLTAEMMKSFGVTVNKGTGDGKMSCCPESSGPAGGRGTEDSGTVFCLPGRDCYIPRIYEIEPDMSAAAYFYALAAVTGIKISVRGVSRHMLQGDTRFIDVLEKMGCGTESLPGEAGLVLSGPEEGKLRGGFTVDMSAFSDQALTLAAIAPYADAPIRITGIGHIRLQECDRIHAITHNLKKLGIRAEEENDSVTIYPGKPGGGDVETFNDHRVAMSFALTGLRAEGVRILNPSCCRKTFAEYFDVLDRVLAE